MNINKFTQKSIEAVNQCEKIAYDHGHQEIDQEHFLYSLLTIDDSLIASLLEKMGINKETFLSQVQELLNKKPKVSGGQVYMSNDLNQVLLHGEDEMKAMKDEYVEQSIYKVKTVDTTAAGDTYTGYFIAGILNGKTIKEAMDTASKASAIAVSRQGAAPSIPYLEEVEEYKN